jgi:hypothetical protein
MVFGETCPEEVRREGRSERGRAGRQPGGHGRPLGKMRLLRCLERRGLVRERIGASARSGSGGGFGPHLHRQWRLCPPGQASATLCSTHATPWTPCRVDDPACSGMVAPSASTDTAGYPDGQTLALLQDRQAGAVPRLVGPGLDHEGPHPAARSGPPTTCVLHESPGARPNASGSHQLLAAAEHDQQLRRR